MKSAWERAQRLQTEAAASGFDWPALDGVLDKLREEVAELAEAAADETDADRQRRSVEELGDVLFVLARLAQRLQLDAEDALDGAAARFEQRFAYVMRDAAALPPPGDPERLAAMEARWQAAKRRER